MESIDTEKLIKDVLDSSRNDIISSFKKKIIEDISNSMYYQFKAQMEGGIAKFYEEELSEELQCVMRGAKDKIVKEMEDGFVKVGGLLSKAMYEKALENLNTSSYRSGEIMKKLFE